MNTLRIKNALLETPYISLGIFFLMFSLMYSALYLYEAQKAEYTGNIVYYFAANDLLIACSQFALSGTILIILGITAAGINFYYFWHRGRILKLYSIDVIE